MAGGKMSEASSRKGTRAYRKLGKQGKRTYFLAISALPVYVRAQASLKQALASGREIRLVFL